jgi:hypothetical protein
MKYIKTFENVGIEYDVYYTDSKDGKIRKNKFYSKTFKLDNAYTNVRRLINSFIEVDKFGNYIDKPRFDHWFLVDYYINIIKDGKIIDVIDKQMIDAKDDIEKFNL